MARSTASNSAPDETVAEVMTDRELNKANGNKAVTPTVAPWDDDELRALRSFDDVISLMAETGVEVIHADEVMGDGFTVINDKNILCGSELMFLEWRINSGNMGEFVSARLVAKMPGGAMGKFIINDGSTGLKEQLKKFSARTGKFGGLHVRKGLRRSDYEVTIDNETRTATTYYLDLSGQ